MNQSTLNGYKQALLAHVISLLPKEQMYFNGLIVYCDAIKYIDEKGEISYFETRQNNLRITHIDSLPFDSLLDLRDKLLEWKH